MNMGPKLIYEWNTFPSSKIDRRGDVKAVHRLQHLMIQSWFAKILAIHPFVHYE